MSSDGVGNVVGVAIIIVAVFWLLLLRPDFSGVPVWLIGGSMVLFVMLLAVWVNLDRR